MSKKNHSARKERFWYILGGFLAFAGLVFLIFGIIGDHMPVKASDNWVIYSQDMWLTNWSGMGYRYWGLILLGLGTLIAVIALTYFASSGDRDSERAARRAQRLALESEEAEVVEETPSAN